MPYRQRPIFVLDIRNEATFAFEAEHLAQARNFVDAPWFAGAVFEFSPSKHGGWDDSAARRTRAATEPEAAIYRDYADEFAEVSDQFLIARLSTTA
jgi:hypothetical protein